MSEHGLFDEECRLRRLSELGDTLEKLDAVVDWEIFRKPIEKVTAKEARGDDGRTG